MTDSVQELRGQIALALFLLSDDELRDKMYQLEAIDDRTIHQWETLKLIRHKLGLS